MAFNLDNYVDVPTRLAEALKRWPDLRIQETDNQVITMPDGSTFIRCTVTVWRDIADPIPVIASAAEPFPGNTPYTKRSEYMVGMTSALGRALGYMGCGVAKAIASRNEVEARLQGNEATITPMRTPKEGGAHASSKQLYMIKALAKGKGLDDLAALEAMQLLLDADDVILETFDNGPGVESYRGMETMTRYNGNYGSHDQLQDLRKLNMGLHHELDAIKRLLDETTKELHQAQDELLLAIEALVRARDIKP